VRKIDQQVTPTLVQEAADFVPQHDIATLVQPDLACHGEDDDVSDDALLDLHESSCGGDHGAMRVWP
jgi:hypothetical protein